MFLYHLTIQPPTTIQRSITGNFTGTSPTLSELCLIRGTMMIEILRLDASTGKMVSITMVNTFSIIRGMDKMRLAGQDKGMFYSTS